MVRTYEFYEKNLSMTYYQVNKILLILENVENGIYNESEIRSLGEEGVKLCICEGKYDVFKTLVSPFSYEENGIVRYRYLLDAVSLGLVEFINDCPSSIMEHWAKVNQNDSMNCEFAGIEHFTIPVEYTSRDAIVLYPALKKELIDSILKIDKEKIMTIKIKDVLARQISGFGHPIKCVQDVIYYAELPLLYPCLDLFKKNIITTCNDTGGCYDDYETDDNKEFITDLSVNYDCLDEANKVVADALVENGNAYIYENHCGDKVKKELVLEVPCKRNETVYQVSLRMMKLVSKFHKQDMIYGQIDAEYFYNMFNRWSFCLSEEDFEKVNSILEGGYTSENIIEVMKYFEGTGIEYYYDKEEDKFWISEYYYKKHRKFIEEQLEFGSQGLK